MGVSYIILRQDSFSRTLSIICVMFPQIFYIHIETKHGFSYRKLMGSCHGTGPHWYLIDGSNVHNP